jgi:hypothetical protein
MEGGVLAEWLSSPHGLEGGERVRTRTLDRDVICFDRFSTIQICKGKKRIGAD